jgi:hypothetical protein
LNHFLINVRYFISFYLLRSIFISILLFLSVWSSGQVDGLYTEVVQPEKGDTIKLQAEAISYESLTIEGFRESKDYKLYGINNIIWLAQSPSQPVTIRYRKFHITTSFSNKSDSIIGRTFATDPFRTGEASLYDMRESGSLNTVGNISRGVGFGNAQDVVVNSNLNLNLSGKLNNGMEVLAVISDENNPIQPEGNTQQLQDFDQVYIQLSKENLQMTFGDFAMAQSPQSYFMKYNKRSRGMQYANSFDLKKGVLTLDGEAAISRGRFARNLIDGIEGNAGPYRLSGENGEIFLIIIAGTEVVYLDGRQLTRGEDHDYVINYNTGEITFTPKIMITKFSRIVVEFQYSDRNYARTVTRTGLNYKRSNTKFYTNFFNEMDLKNQPFQQDLEGFDSLQNASVVELLERAGDGQAITSRVRKTGEQSGDRPLYRKVILGLDEYYEYAVPSDSIDALYEVSFTNVGPGNGSYVIKQSGLNGRVFQYVGPNMGDYAPFEVLIAPERKNLWTMGFVTETENTLTGLEMAWSGYDQNTFSNLDNENNMGLGAKGFFKNEKNLRDTSGLKLMTDINFEVVSSNFSFIERYRDVEFDRIWNRLLVNTSALSIEKPAMEFIGNAKIKLIKKKNFIEYRFANFQRGNIFDGLNHQINGIYNFNGFQITSNAEFLNTKQQMDVSSQFNDFYRLNIGLEKAMTWATVGGLYQKEQSAFSLNQDSLIFGSYQFEQYSAFVRSGAEKKVKYELRADQRLDNTPFEGGFINSTLGRNINFSADYISKKNNRIISTIVYRTLEILDTNLSDDLLEQTLQSRQEFDFNFLNGMFRSRTFLETGAGQEQRREFQFLQVQPGNGLYVWNDYNQDGIKTLDEFELASPLDAARADYIKVFVPVAGFFTTITNKWSQTFEINPMKYYKRTNAAGKRNFITRFYSITTMAMDKKVLPTSLGEILNPFYTESQEDTSLINQRQNFRSTLFFNRGNPVYTLDYTYLNNQSKLLLTNGFESRYIADHIFKSRFNLSKLWIFSQKLATGNRRFGNEFFTTRDFNYDFYEIEPEIALQIKNAYRFGLNGRYYDAKNIEELGGQRAESIDIGITAKYTKPEKGTADLSFSYVKVDFDGEVNSNLGYDILRGLQNGNNYVWMVNYAQKLASSIQIVLSYEGRTAENSPIIHIGRLQARYLF